VITPVDQHQLLVTHESPPFDPTNGNRLQFRHFGRLRNFRTITLMDASDGLFSVRDRVIIVTPVTNVIGAVYCSVDQTIGDETKFTVLTNSDDGTNNSVSFYVTVMRKDVG
jgi:hypothetical protein